MNKKNIPIKCVRCSYKFEAKEMVYYDNKFFCLQCTKTLNGCGSCKNQFYCDFKQNPVPIPKATIVKRKEEPILINEKIPNPKRIKAAVIKKVRQYLENKPNISLPNDTIDIFFHRTLSDMINRKNSQGDIVLNLVNQKPQMEFNF